MIIDQLSNLEKYFNDAELANVIKEFLLSAEQKEVGTHDILGGTFAKVQSYETNPLTQVKMEAHEKYLDLQYIHKGCETVIHKNLTVDKPVTEYNPDKDVVFYSPTEYNESLLNQGYFAIMFPSDLHQCVAVDTPVKIKKVVVKIPVDAI